MTLYLANLDSRGRSREAGLAGLVLALGTEISLAKAVDGRHPEPVGDPWFKRVFLPAIVALLDPLLYLNRQILIEKHLNCEKH